MKNITLIIILGVFASFSLIAQIVFEKTYGGAEWDYGAYVEQTTDGGYVLTGGTASFGSGGYDFYLVKTDTNGNPLWTKTYGGIDDERGRCVQQTNDEGYIIVGERTGGLYLVKTNSIGSSEWTKNLPGLSVSNVQQTNDGGYIIIGSMISSDSTNFDAYLIKTNSTGDTLWTKYFGGNRDDGGGYIQQTSDGGYIITGYTTSFGVGSAVYLIKTDNNGDTTWTKTFGGYIGGNCVQETSDGGFIIIGDTGTSNNTDICLIKTDAGGSSTWIKIIGNAGEERGNFIQQTSDDGYIIAGISPDLNDNALLIKVDSNGGVLWTKTFGGANFDAGSCVQQTNDGGYILVGTTYSLGGGGSDVYLIKTDANGNIITGLAELSSVEFGIRVYPNPFHDFTTVTISGTIRNNANYLSLAIYDVNCRRIELHQKINSSKNITEIKMENRSLLPGIYYFNVMNGDKKIGSGKLVIQ